MQHHEPNPFQKAVLFGLQDGKHVYAGTVDKAEVKRRRTANKRARAQRKVNARKGR